jgi:N-acetylneuraminate synthase
MVFVCAEIGINHNGNVDNAKKLIDVAVRCGSDAVKFQKRKVEKVYSQDVLDSPRESPFGKTVRDQKIGLELSLKQYSIIDKYCKKQKISWYVSCWDVDSQIEMRRFKTKFNKVASAMLTHKTLLEIISKEKKYTFISTGMSTVKEISEAVKIFRKNKCPFELMHSHSAYPMPEKEANLKVIPFLKKKFNCDVGYSGHEVGSYDVCIPAVVLGATSIERHITLDRTMYGSDQSSSLEEPGLKRLVRDVKKIGLLLGDGKKRIWDSELPAMKKLRQKFI